MTNFNPVKDKQEIDFLVLGDVHLGHHVTHSTHVVDRLYALLRPRIASLDFLIIEGDLFDRLLYLNDTHLNQIEMWILWVLRQCKEHDVVLRVLEGTPSHDMEQSDIFIRFNEHMGINCDVMHVTDLVIEQNEKYGLSFLYLPDEWSPHVDKAYHAAVEQMKLLGLETVDFVIMHGSFDYQFPKGLGLETHNSELWQRLVNYHIFIGHIHTHSQKGKILAAGSFDRITHGEEEPKGMIHCKLFDKGTTIKFIENEQAWAFITLDVRQMDVDEAYIYAKKRIEALGKPVHGKPRVRLHGLKNSFLDALRDRLLVEFDHIFFSPHKYEDVKNKQETLASSLTGERFVPIDITVTNIHSLVKDRLTNRLADSDIQLIMDKLDELTA